MKRNNNKVLEFIKINSRKLGLFAILMLALFVALVMFAAKPVDAMKADSTDENGWPPSFVSSYKGVSQKNLAPGEILTYTIHLYNASTIDEIVKVTDPIPTELALLPGTITGGGIFDEASRTITWLDISVGAGEGKDLYFKVQIGEIDVTNPMVVTNVATITYKEVVIERKADIILNPTHVDSDDVNPVVHDLTIGSQDIISDPIVTVVISATDNISVDWMYLKEFTLITEGHPHWLEVNRSGWVPYHESFNWTLTSAPGVHFLGVWVADGNMNRSHDGRAGLDYISLIVSNTQIKMGDTTPYAVFYEKGQQVTATLKSITGDVDLYVWHYRDMSQPLHYSIGSGEEDTISFTTELRGSYIFEVHAESDATYDLSITPAGGPSAWSMNPIFDETKIPLTIEPILTQSGVNPLALENVGPSTSIHLFMPSLGQRR